MSMDEQMQDRFKTHPARSQYVKDQHTQIRNASALFATLVLQLTPTCREQSLALTKVEEAMFWANAAIARDPKNRAQEGEEGWPTDEQIALAKSAGYEFNPGKDS